ncbi:single-stranded DNA-binding protein [Lactococcus cremoris]|uniref:single-stranded DNA-binding protein n=1 Tax=Lactococcus lactis subsp. cremoris TaxID=1359 RepID=UPI001964D36F|nr:single-stranded DNA-binding protein [Lactococcus cremoris]QRZ32189.1 single-stranded DNA-binding protein [Lactococcus cremoris]
MSIITTVVQVNDKNTRTVNTQKGEKQVISTPIIKDSTGKWVYASAFINFKVEPGDILTISGRIEPKEDGQYLNNNFVFPTVERLYKPKETASTSYPAKDIPNIGEDMEINDEDLPF